MSIDFAEKLEEICEVGFEVSPDLRRQKERCRRTVRSVFREMPMIAAGVFLAAPGARRHGCVHMLTGGFMRRWAVCVAFVFAISLGVVPAHGATISFNSVAVSPNTSFSLDILGTDLDDLFSFNFDLSFDPAVVELVSVVRGNVFSGVGLPCPECFSPGFSDSPGILSFVADSISGQVAGVNGAGTLATLTFNSLARDGSANMAFGLVEMFSPPALGGMFPVPIEGIDVRNGTVTVRSPQPVPEPSTLALLAAGLAAVARKRLKKKPSVN